MFQFSADIERALANVPGIDMGEVRRALRIKQVRDIWAQLVEQPILDHTNAVYIFTQDGTRQMYVYVDESIYAAELNNRRELLKLTCREQFGEELDSFHIHISKGKRKSEYPYRRDINAEDTPSVPLTEEEWAQLQQAAAAIPDNTLRTKFMRAMQTDLEWKKGQAAQAHKED